MNSEMRHEDPKKLWQNQPLEGTTMSLEEICSRIEKLGKKVRKRNLIRGFASMFVLLGFTYFFVVFSNVIQRIGAALTVLGAGYLAYQLVLAKMHRLDTRGKETETSLEFYRSELERQRDFHCGLWFWSRLIICAPGPLIFCIGSAMASPASAKVFLVIALTIALELIAAVPLNFRLSRKYQRELDALDSTG